MPHDTDPAPGTGCCLAFLLAILFWAAIAAVLIALR